MSATSHKKSDKTGITEPRIPTLGDERADQWRQWLSASPDPVVAVIDEAVERLGLAPVSGLWRRIYARLEPDPAPDRGLAGTLVYEVGHGSGNQLFLVECRTGCAPEVGSHAAMTLPWGFARAFPFWQDPGLPTLARVVMENPTAQVLRYRPFHRCTLRVDTGGSRFAKVFPDGRGLRLYDEGLALWQAATSGGLTFAVPEPLGWDPDTRTFWMGHVVGEPVGARLRAPGGVALAELMGRACGELTVSALSPTKRFCGADQMANSGRYVRNLSILVPSLADDAHHLLEDLATIHAGLDVRPLRPIHGAPHRNQWLADGDRLGLVDFDSYCLGDPELDAATFVADVECENPAKTPREVLNAAFLRGHADLAGPLQPCLLTAYRAHKRLEKADKAARKPLVHAAELAARHLGSARRMLVDDGLAESD